MIPSVPISWGELADKITILEIKSELLSSLSARENVKNELARLAAIWEPIERDNRNAVGLKMALKHTNKTLWQIEDQIREKEAQKCFDAVGAKQKTMKVFTREEGGYHHCQIDNQSICSAAMWDWLERVLQPSR